MRNLLLASLTLIIISATLFCKPQSTATKNTLTGDTTHTSRTSLDWDGIYRGVLPCADCEGIQKTVYLNKDGSYRLKIKYLGKQTTSSESSGTFEWNSHGNTITLSENGQPVSFFVGENTLTELDKSGNKVTGQLAPNYVLSKDQFAILEKYWKLTELNGKPIEVDSSFRKEPHIIFKDDGNRFVGNGGCNGFSGTYKLGSMNRINLSQGVTTQMACPKMELESQFLKVLQMADNYTVTGDMLILNKARMAPLARFKTVYMK
ncbi:MAG: copper resistance protein NlpE N-terminal domain-containing protein [Chitinophagaceae bacterium]|nr:copper resistance protein NlpE N-terminal domain-containing protein [Chitinophagaceae bacterium]